MIHPLADVQSSQIGKGTKVWQFCVVLGGAQIGKNCNICMNVFIENDVVIGDNVTVKCGVQLWDGLRVEDDVFIGPNVTFTNDLIPRSGKRPAEFLKTVLKRGASIGAGSVIIAGHTIGEYALVGAGSVVTKDIPPHTVWYGNPAKQRGYITKSGTLDYNPNFRLASAKDMPLSKRASNSS
ncbi:MAG: N-acetyltransferase [Fibromonadaceae bacterium]|jgi:acetyltransferase-like isoleucine patch superfamily enzyme|nr:N-acetyltransferase [Fibromonadaceae bacterium]